MWETLFLAAACGAEWTATSPDDAGSELQRLAAAESHARLPSAPVLVDLASEDPPSAEGKVAGTLRITEADGYVVYDGPAAVGFHGRSSLEFPKPQWSVELRDDAGEDRPADLFGMGRDADWLLNGMYVDRALLRNKLTYDLYRDLTGHAEWAPQSTYAELTWQGEYMGVYQFAERIDPGDGRTPVLEDDGTGRSFIVRADEEGMPSDVQYASWLVLYPNEADQTPEMLDAIRARLLRMEDHARSGEETIWEEVDLDSFVAFILLEEAVKNVDAYFLSYHLYVAEDGRIHFVPWDIDLSMGQPDYGGNEDPESWIGGRSELISGMGRLPGVRERMDETWAAWRAGALADDAVEARILAGPTFLGDAVDRNFERWPIETVQFGDDTLYPIHSYEAEIAQVKAFWRERLRWMDANVSTWSTSGAP